VLALAIAGIDAAIGESVVLIPLLVIVPVLAAIRLGPGDTAAIGLFALAVAASLGPVDDILGEEGYFVRLTAVAGSAALSVPLAAARDRARALRRRSGFLAEAARVLNSSLDPDTTLRNLARLSVPAVCDWCIVDLIEGGGQLRRVASTHGPDDDRAQELDDHVRPDLGADTPLTRALRTGEAQLVARVPREVSHDPEHLAALRSLGIRSAIVAPMRVHERVLGALTFATAESGRRYDEDDLAPAAGLAVQVGLAIDNARLFAETRSAERRAEEGRALLDTLFATAPVGLGFFDRDLRYQRVNEALAVINGVAADDHIGRTLGEVVPEMDPAVAAAFQRVIETGEPIVDHEVTVVTPAAPGDPRHWLASYYPVHGEDREVVGLGVVVIEVTERHRSQDELRAQKELYEAILRAQSDVGEGFLILEDERIVYANAAAEQITGYEARELGRFESLAEIVHDDLREELRERLEPLREEPGAAKAIHHTKIVRRDGEEVALELAVAPLGGPEDRRLVVVARDVTARQRAEQERTELLAAERIARAAAETSQRRATFLAEASALLDTSLSLEQTFANVARLCVPYLAEFCSVSVADPGGSVRRVALSVEDPERARELEELERRWPTTSGGEHPVAAVVAAGRTEVLREVPDQALQEVAEDQEHLNMLRRTRTRTAVIAPLRARGRTLGAITLGRWEGANYSPTDIALLEELARRAGMAIDNARLYEERSYIARTLQRSLLPPRLPDIPGVETAARYRAAGEGVEVGGDFYDVFETVDARFAVAVGDVCGKGAKAAAITSLARHTLRAAAMHERLPSEALLMLNEALRRQELDTDFCTVAYAHLRPTPSGEVALLLANGGHPPPLLLRSTGDVGPVGRPGTLLGVVPDPRLSDTALTLSPGDSLVLYTDGVTEASTPDGMFGSERLEELVRSCAGLRAAAIADVIERAVMDEQNGEARDDIAILVLRAAPTA